MPSILLQPRDADLSTGPALIVREGDEDLRVPASVHEIESFRRWALSDRFPERGRIDFLVGNVEIDMSPEDLFTHGAVKAAVAASLHLLIAETDLGQVYIDRARVTAPEVGLSAEPDVVVVLWSSLEARRCRLVPTAKRGKGRFAEIEGGPDVVVEILSDGSEKKDLERLPPLYSRAKVGELWRIDARGAELVFSILTLAAGDLRPVSPDADGWIESAALGRRFRLRREPGRLESWRYRLEHVAKVGSASPPGA